MNLHVSKQQPGHPLLLPKPETEGLTELAPSPVSHVLSHHWSGLATASCQMHHEVMSDQPSALELCTASLFSLEHQEGH